MNQQSQPTSLYPVERGDELSLIELWKVLVEYKLLIIVFTALTTLGAIYYVSTLPTIYKAEVLMVPSSKSNSRGTGLSGNLNGLAGIVGFSSSSSSIGAKEEEALARLRTRVFLTKHIKEKNLKPILFADKWDGAKKQWIGTEPSNREATELLRSMIAISTSVKDKSGVIVLTVNWKNPRDPSKIANIANELVASMNVNAKQREILEAKKSKFFLKRELETTEIVNFKLILYNLIEQQTSRIMLANIRDEFVFSVIDPAVEQLLPDSKPTLLLIFIGSMMGLLGSCFFVITIRKSKVLIN